MKLLKTMAIIFIVDLISNIVLLLFFGIAINQQTIIGALIFTVILTLILKQSGILKEG